MRRLDARTDAADAPRGEVVQLHTGTDAGLTSSNSHLTGPAETSWNEREQE